MFSCFRLQLKLIDSLLAILLFHVRSSTLSRLPVSALTFCTFSFSTPPPPLRSRRRASINPLAQKKAAQRRDAKLTQLLAQNDEVRDADFILLPTFKWGVRQRVGCGEEAKAGKGMGWRDVRA